MWWRKIWWLIGLCKEAFGHGKYRNMAEIEDNGWNDIIWQKASHVFSSDRKSYIDILYHFIFFLGHWLSAVNWLVAWCSMVTFSPVRVQSIVISVSVCLSVCPLTYLKPNFMKFSVHRLTCGCGLVLLWQGSHKPGKPWKPGIVRQVCKPGKVREKSGNLRYSQGIFLWTVAFFASCLSMSWSLHVMCKLN